VNAFRGFFAALREVGEVASDGWIYCARCQRYYPRLIAHWRGEGSCRGPSLPRESLTARALQGAR